MSYAAVYRALVKPPPERVIIMRGEDYVVFLDAGPLFFRHQSAVVDPLSGGNAFELKYHESEFPSGSYLVVYVMPADVTMPGAGWVIAHDRFARTVATLELDFPGIVQEKLFEDAVADPATELFIAPEGGLDMSGHSAYQYANVAEVLKTRTAEAISVSEKDGALLTLASRWFRRANDTKNVIDRILFYYMVLEVYPTVKGADVPRAVSRFLVEHVYPNLSEKEVKERLNLGRICGFRGEIVHEGKASATTFDEWQRISDYEQRLRAIARTCLRVLAGWGPGSDLDQYVVPRSRDAARP